MEDEEEFKEFLVAQIERIEGSKCRTFPAGTYQVWWTDGVQRHNFTRADVEHAATQLCESEDAFPILSAFIYHCGTARRKRQERERVKEAQLADKTKHLGYGDILSRGAQTAISETAKAAIKNTQDFLNGKIDRDTWKKKQDKIEKGLTGG